MNNARVAGGYGVLAVKELVNKRCQIRTASGV